MSIKIQPVNHKSLVDNTIGKLAASMLDGSLVAGTQLPPERELMSQLGISRSTLREALKSLEDERLIESGRGVGWFVHAMDETTLSRAKELACDAASDSRSATKEPNTAPLRVPIGREKPIHIPNLKKDRFGTFEFISWWDREKVQNARVMVIGAGALGNEVT